MERTEINDEMVDDFYERLNREAQEGGYRLKQCPRLCESGSCVGLWVTD